MNNMEKLNLNIGIPGGDFSGSKNILTLAKAISLIKLKNYPKEIEDSLIKEISKKPSSTFDNFLKNISTHMLKIQNKKNKKN